MVAPNPAFRPVLWRALDPDGNAHDYCRRPENVCTEVAWATADGRATIHHGDCLDVMRTMPDGSVDAVVTDPPYALTANKKGGTGAASVNLDSPYGRARIGTGNGGGGFMGQAWDASLPTVEMWVEALRVAKPGAHLLAFGGTRTFHRLTCAIEDAGWEIRDCLSWLYGSGFPKSHNGAWGGTALKPAWEPVVLARKPLIGTVEANHAAHGTGALNIDGCRIATTDSYSYPNGPGGNLAPTSLGMRKDGTSSLRRDEPVESHPLGRWPANVALDEEAARALDEQSGISTSTGGQASLGAFRNGDVYGKGRDEREARDPGLGDSGGASRFFYTAKASRSEREAGLDGLPIGVADPYGEHRGRRMEDKSRIDGKPAKRARNVHPTVKPVDLMRWLVRLVTPLGGTVLDPFLGSGTTGVAALQEGCRFVGIEREAQYVEIAKARVAHEAAQGSLFSAVENVNTAAHDAAKGGERG